MKKQTKEFSDACTKLVLHPEGLFFIDFLFSLECVPQNPLIVSGGMRVIAATDGLRVLYDEELFGALTVSERVFVIAHELMHVMMMHSTRRGGRDPMVWNIAADYVVNGMLATQQMAMPTKDCLMNSAFDGMSSEKVYDLLIEDMQKQPDERVFTKEFKASMRDVLDYKGSVPVQEIEKKIKQQMQSAIQKQLKTAGKISAGLQRLADIVMVEKLPWHELLKNYMICRDTSETTWARMNNREYITKGLVMPVKHSRSLRRIVVGIDCSGSISEKQLGSMETHLSDLFNLCRPKEVTLMYFDARVLKVTEMLHRDYDVKLEFVGGGGTCFEPVFEKIDAEYPDTDVLLMFTDLYGSFPEDSNVPCVWVTSSEGVEVPFGELIHADFND